MHGIEAGVPFSGGLLAMRLGAFRPWPGSTEAWRCCPPSSSAGIGLEAFEYQPPTQPALGLSQHPFASLSAGPQRLFDLSKATSGTSPVYRVVQMQGDGRCMFRALAQGLARSQGMFLGPEAETQEADQLRGAVTEALCRSDKRRGQFAEALTSIQTEDNLKHYCERLQDPAFWGGEPELLVLSKMLKLPIYVYVDADARSAQRRYKQLYAVGDQYSHPGKTWKKRAPVRLLYTNGNHYDLLVAR